MNCLILAAGLGSRLRELSESKPLTPVAGVPLIEHVVDRAAAAGASNFTIVTGHLADRVEAFVATLAARLGVPIRCVRTADWSRPNGFSVVDGAAAIEGDYLLLMSDHLFDPAIAASLLARPAAPLILAVDYRSDSPLIDLEDATKVAVGEEGRIARIGKTIERWDAVDTGLFRTGPILAEAIGESLERGGQGSLSEGVQALADRGEAFTLDVTGRWWLDVDDPRAHALAEEYFRSGFRVA